MTMALPTLLNHSTGYILAACAVSLIGSWLLVGLMNHARSAQRSSQNWWFGGVMVVAGINVWTTHFVAMLGYRPDLFLSYDLRLTLLSVLIGIVAVGAPLAISCIRMPVNRRIMLGAVAGLGIGAMHFTGMAAIADCSTSQTIFSTAVALLTGCIGYGAVRMLQDRGWSRNLVALFYSLGLCATHFIAVSGFTAYPIEGFLKNEWSGVEIGSLVVGGASIIFAGFFLSLVTSRKFIAQERSHAEVLSTALNNMSNGLIYVGHEGSLRLFNQRFTDLFGLNPANVRNGMPVAELFDEMSASNGWEKEERNDVRNKIMRRLTAGSPITSDYTTSTGKILQVVSGPVHEGAVITFDDVTKERHAQNRISHLAYHDELTGLSNRRALQERMESAILPKRRYKLLILDLDRFKLVNDSFGHKIGDLLLKQVAIRLMNVTDGKHFIARFGGDEFATLVFGDLESSMTVANEIIASLTNSFEINGHHISVGCSIGMCCTDDAGSVDDLLQRADVALYEAKRAGRGRVECYREGLLDAVTERSRLENDIQQAIDAKEFTLAFQPVMSLESEKIIGHEALIRWHHPTRGNVPPAEFIPFAEETGQILAIGKWVLEEACRCASRWPDDQYVAVNVSPVQFRSQMLYHDVVSALEKSGLPARRLELELTETALVQDGPSIAKMLTSLKCLGVTVAMDDFGTGYSSLAHLCDFPLDRIKIDRSFVQKASVDSSALAILKAVTQIGRDIHVSILAEGVETDEQLNLVRKLGCEDAQGYLIGRPLELSISQEKLRAALRFGS